MQSPLEKPTYPPLFYVDDNGLNGGFKEVKFEDLYNIFLSSKHGLDTPYRRRLTEQLRLFIKELEKLGVHGELWIDGSYVTRKPDPRDVDLFLISSLRAVKMITRKNMKRLLFLSGKDGKAYTRIKYQADFHVCEESNDTRKEEFKRLFSNNPDQENQKGIPLIRL